MEHVVIMDAAPDMCGFLEALVLASWVGVRERDAASGSLRDTATDLLRDTVLDLLRDTASDVSRDTTSDSSRDTASNLLRDTASDLFPRLLRIDLLRVRHKTPGWALQLDRLRDIVKTGDAALVGVSGGGVGRGEWEEVQGGRGGCAEFQALYNRYHRFSP